METAKEAAKRLAAGPLSQGFVAEALHRYTDASGEPIYWRIRAKHADGRKWIRPMKLNGHGYEIGEPEFANGKPLYRLHDIAGHADELVWIVEGEKKADALAALGVVVTTSGSATSAGAADWSPLKGRTCVIWRDNDEPGKAYGGDVAARLLELGCEVSAIDVDKLGLPEHGDVVDWLQTRQNASSDDLERLPRLTPSADAKNAPGAHTSRNWPEPRALPDGLLPVAEFDMELLPATLRPWIADISDRVQCAPDFVAVAAMTALGAASGRKVAIRPQARTDWTEVPNQWALVIGRPGVLKSPAIEQALAPLRRLEAQANQAHEDELRRHQAKKMAQELRDKAAKHLAMKALNKNPGADLSGFISSDEDDAEPVCRRYRTNDTSAASLGELHRQNPNGLLVHRDELVSLLRDLEREENASARGFYLTGWNGDSPYTIDRIGRGMNLHIPAVCLSLLGSTQPGRIAGYVKAAVHGGERDDGLIQRFGMLVWPDVGGDWRDVDRWPDGDAKREAFRVFERLDALDAMTIGAEQDTDFDGEPTGVPYLRCTDEARELFLEWRTQLEARLRSGELPAALESHLAKYRKLVSALALLLHLANGGTGPVSAGAMLQALAWAEYLETHARRAYASGVSGEVAAANAILTRIRKGDLPQEFSRRDVWRPGWTGLADREGVASALELLVDYAWLDTQRQETGGRTAIRYVVNPRGLT